MEQYFDIGERLRLERERLGLSQTTFAGVVNATKGSQINWEKGKTSPDAACLQGWAKIGVDIAYVVTGASASYSDSRMSADETVLLDSYRSANQTVRNTALTVLLSGGASPIGLDTRRSKKGTSRVSQKVKNNHGVVAGGDVKKGT